MSDSRRLFSSIGSVHVGLILQKVWYSPDEELERDVTSCMIGAFFYNFLQSEHYFPKASSIGKLAIIHLPIETPLSDIYFPIAGSSGKWDSSIGKFAIIHLPMETPLSEMYFPIAGSSGKWDSSIGKLLIIHLPMESPQ